MCDPSNARIVSDRSISNVDWWDASRTSGRCVRAAIRSNRLKKSRLLQPTPPPWCPGAGVGGGGGVARIAAACSRRSAPSTPWSAPRNRPQTGDREQASGWLQKIIRDR
jgi:hypothetical protein